MSRRPQVHIERLVVNGRALSRTEIEQWAARIAADLGSGAWGGADARSATTPSAAGAPIAGDFAMAHLARVIAAEVRRRLP